MWGRPKEAALLRLSAVFSTMPLSDLRGLITRLVLPTTDLGINQETTALTFPDDLPPFLAVNAGMGPDRPHLLSVTADGALYTASDPATAELSPTSGLIQLIPSRTDAATVTLGPFNSGGYANAALLVRLTALTGTSPTFQPLIALQDHIGVQYTLVAGTQLTVIGSTTVLIGIASGKTILFDPYYVKVLIGGTTPSATWSADILYH